MDCAPLLVGRRSSPSTTTAPNYALDLYDQWFDADLAPVLQEDHTAAYLNDIYNYFGDARTQASAQCLVSKLPPPEQRPDAPAGRW